MRDSLAKAAFDESKIKRDKDGKFGGGGGGGGAKDEGDGGNDRSNKQQKGFDGLNKSALSKLEGTKQSLKESGLSKKDLKQQLMDNDPEGAKDIVVQDMIRKVVSDDQSPQDLADEVENAFGLELDEDQMNDPKAFVEIIETMVEENFDDEDAASKAMEIVFKK